MGNTGRKLIFLDVPFMERSIPKDEIYNSENKGNSFWLCSVY